MAMLCPVPVCVAASVPTTHTLTHERRHGPTSSHYPHYCISTADSAASRPNICDPPPPPPPHTHAAPSRATQAWQPNIRLNSTHGAQLTSVLVSMHAHVRGEEE